MNIFYRNEQARVYLNAYLARASQETNAIPYFAQMVQAPDSDFKVERRPDSNIRSPRLTVQDETGAVHEVCVRLPGILCRKTLPPMTREMATEPVHVIRGLKQSVKLTGMGDEVFEQFQDAVAKAQGIFEKELGKDKVRGLNSKPYEGRRAFDISARYFTDRDDAPTQEHIPFRTDEDPKYILELARKHRFIHGEDNIVQYCTKALSAEGKASYMPASPDNFREGDIVEVHVAFGCWPIGKDVYQLGLVLRALCMVNTEFREEAERQVKDLKVATNSDRQRKHRLAGETADVKVKRQRIVYDMGD